MWIFCIIVEDKMKVSDIRLEMELANVDEADIAEIIKLHQSKALTLEMIDEELQKRGYSAVFSVDYDAYSEYDDYDDWDDEYASIEKFPHKHVYQ
jgi:outer membrane protein assembly factor BamA